MDEEKAKNQDSAANIRLSDLLAEKDDVHAALEHVFEMHRNNMDKDPKILFIINSSEDVNYTFNLMKEMQRRVIYQDFLPESIVQDILKGDCTDITTSFWPSSWVTSIEFNQGTHVDLHSMKKIYCLPNIVKLSLKFQSDDVPLFSNCIGKLKHIKSFNICSSRQSSLPSVLQFCENLEELDLSFNSLRFLPFWITKLKNLNKLCRQGNPLQHEVKPCDYIETCTVKSTVKKEDNHVNKSGEKVTYSPRSLFVISAATVLVEFPELVLDENKASRPLPTNVLADLALMASDLKFCDKCSQGFFSDEHIVVRKTFQDFKGYKYIPFEAVCCSDVCAEEIAEEWTLIVANSESEDIKTCFENPDAPEILERIAYYRERRLRRKRISRIVKTMFCCCCCD